MSAVAYRSSHHGWLWGCRVGREPPQVGRKRPKETGLWTAALLFLTQPYEELVRLRTLTRQWYAGGWLCVGWVVTTAVEGDPFKQQLLGGSSQGSKFIFLGHSAQLTSWNILWSLSQNDQSHLYYWEASSMLQAANTKIYFYFFNLAVLQTNFFFFNFCSLKAEMLCIRNMWGNPRVCSLSAQHKGIAINYRCN